MAANYVLLERVTVGAAGAASVTFNNIPQTGYTDLKIVGSIRTNRATYEDYIKTTFNGSTTSQTAKMLVGSGSSAASYSTTNDWTIMGADSSIFTANTFTSFETYIPNYTSSNYKSFSVDAVGENNGTTAYSTLAAGLWSYTAAITSITMAGTGSFVQYSTFSLYGIAAVGTTPAIAPYAAGGDIIQTDGTYWYHAFLSSGTFTPAKALSCDYLVVAGGGAGAGNFGGGGGAGGYRTATGSGLTSGTAYTISVGAGGAGTGTQGTSGTDSYISGSGFTTFTSTGGGYGGGWSTGTTANGASGGSGGGTRTLFWSPGSGNTPATSPSQGNNGGSYSGSGNSSSGGGGAGAAGTASSNSTGGAGGIGSYTAISGGATTALGQLSGGNYYFAGGGSGINGSTSTITGGVGGGGAGVMQSADSPHAIANTGGGGGGNYNGSTISIGGNGGSGVIIIRYAV